MEIWFTTENYDTMEKRWYCGKIYATMPKTKNFKKEKMIDSEKLWNFDL